MQEKYLDNNGLLYVWKKLRDTFVKKLEFDEVKNSIPKNVSDLQDADSYAKIVDIPTKVARLSDVTDYEKKAEIAHSVSELYGIDAYAKNTALPKTVADLTDGADYIKKAELTEEVKSLIENVKSIEFSVVEELPTSEEQAIIHLVSNSKEEVNRKIYHSLQELQLFIFEHINGLYNSKIPHGSFGMLTPNKKEEIFWNQT